MELTFISHSPPDLHRVSHIHKTKEKQRAEEVGESFLRGATWKRGVAAAVGSVPEPTPISPQGEKPVALVKRAGVG